MLSKYGMCAQLEYYARNANKRTSSRVHAYSLLLPRCTSDILYTRHSIAETYSDKIQTKYKQIPETRNQTPHHRMNKVIGLVNVVFALSVTEAGPDAPWMQVIPTARQQESTRDSLLVVEDKAGSTKGTLEAEKDVELEEIVGDISRWMDEVAAERTGIVDDVTGWSGSVSLPISERRGSNAESKLR